MSRSDALYKAHNMNLDLLCVAPNNQPPVCKLLNYGKYRFEAQKRQKLNKKKQTVVNTKEVRLTPQIGIHDLETKANQAIKFFQNGDKVKVSVRFRGRQLSHVEVGEEVLNKFVELVNEYAVMEKKPVLDGKFLSAVLASKVKKQEERSMPKMKTKRALAKRVKKVGNGKLKINSAYTSHLAHNKTHKQKKTIKKGFICI